MSNKNEGKSFWSTVPGILTGIAGIITAIGGLIIALNSAGIITILPPPTPTPTLTPTPTITTLTPTPTPTLTYQDSEFREWAEETGQIITLMGVPLVKAMVSRDFEDIEAYSGMIYDGAEKALNEIDQFGVSPTLKPSKDEFKLALQDFKQAGYYGEKWARNRDFYDRETSLKYMESAIEHEKRFVDLLPQE